MAADLSVVFTLSKVKGHTETIAVLHVRGGDVGEVTMKAPRIAEGLTRQNRRTTEARKRLRYHRISDVIMK